MAYKNLEDNEEVLVELLIRVEGSSNLNRITTFTLPVIGRQAGYEALPGQIQFESKTLVKRIINAVRALV